MNRAIGFKAREIRLINFRYLIWRSTWRHEYQYSSSQRPGFCASKGGFLNFFVVREWKFCFKQRQKYLRKITDLLTPWSTVLLEKLTIFHLIKKFYAFYGTRRFITAVTSARHLSLPWARSIQSITSHPVSWISILILSFHLRLGLLSGLLGDIKINTLVILIFLNFNHDLNDANYRIKWLLQDVSAIYSIPFLNLVLHR